MEKINKLRFLWDVFICSLGSFGGAEAHYGVFSKQLVEKKQYLTENQLSELIGLYSLVPGPGSTQTITAIGYLVGGPSIAILTFLIWALPAILIMTSFGVFFSIIGINDSWISVVKYLPTVAIGFIIYAAFSMSKKVLKQNADFILYLIMIISSYFLATLSPIFVPILLIAGGFVYYFYGKENSDILKNEKISLKPKWYILIIVLALAILNEVLKAYINNSYFNLYTDFYKYGYSVLGGGQVLIPLMIEDLVNSQSIISRNDFLSGYAIDQAVPGPLFSFAAFVGARSIEYSAFSGFLAGMLSAFSIFLPGILLVFFIFPLWKDARKIYWFKKFLAGVSITAAALVTMTAIRQIINMDNNINYYIALLISTVVLISKKIPAPIVIIIALMFGFLSNYIPFL